MFRPRFVLPFFCALTCALPATRSHAQTFTSLTAFSNSIASEPTCDLTISGSTMYGTLAQGGANGIGGALFSLPITGGTPTILASMGGLNPSGVWGDLTLIGSTLYGEAAGGGANSVGGVFSVPAAGGPVTLLGSFAGSESTAEAYGNSLTLVGSTLYGTESEGPTLNYGSLFSMPLSGGTVTTLTTFGPMDSIPSGTLTLSPDGTKFYGLTGASSVYNAGTIFSVPITGGTPTTLATFNPSNIFGPGESVLLVGSNLYGVTGVGGANGLGEVFSVPITGGTPTVLASFNGTDGKTPVGGLTLVGSTLYGLTSYGGANNNGTIFSLPLSGGTPTVLHSFNNFVDGETPYGSLTRSGSTLYGTTSHGGSNGRGTVFSLTVPTPEPSSLVLLGLGAMGLAAVGRRARRRGPIAW